MRFYMFLLFIVLFYSNDINSQVKYKIKTKTYLRGVSSKSSSEGSFLYIIQNQTKQKLLIFFIEENNDTLSNIKLLRRKLLRRYGDFSLSMIEWEANMSIENSTTIIPELFVKILKPKEKFKIGVPFTNDKEKQFASKVPLHLLICSERVLSNNFIEMPHFIENIQRYNFGYSGTKIVISISDFMSFISRYGKLKTEKQGLSQQLGKWKP